VVNLTDLEFIAICDYEDIQYLDQSPVPIDNHSIDDSKTHTFDNSFLFDRVTQSWRRPFENYNHQRLQFRIKMKPQALTTVKKDLRPTNTKQISNDQIIRDVVTDLTVNKIRKSFTRTELKDNLIHVSHDLHYTFDLKQSAQTIMKKILDDIQAIVIYNHYHYVVRCDDPDKYKEDFPSIRNFYPCLTTDWSRFRPFLYRPRIRRINFLKKYTRNSFI